VRGAPASRGFASWIAGMTPVLADGLGTPDAGVSEMLLFATILLGGFAFLRLRERGFRGTPRAAGWAAAGTAVATLALAFVLPPIIRPDRASVRPSTRATIQILSPRPGQVFHGNPARVTVRVRVTGGKVVRFTSQDLVPNEGHVHLYVDGALVFMAYSLERTVSVLPGSHHLQAEFVAVDHGPFDPRVLASVAFRVVP
jgi:hypothetical protein